MLTQQYLSFNVFLSFFFHWKCLSFLPAQTYYGMRSFYFSRDLERRLRNAKKIFNCLWSRNYVPVNCQYYNDKKHGLRRRAETKKCTCILMKDIYDHQFMSDDLCSVGLFLFCFLFNINDFLKCGCFFSFCIEIFPFS